MNKRKEQSAENNVMIMIMMTMINMILTTNIIIPMKCACWVELKMKKLHIGLFVIIYWKSCGNVDGVLALDIHTYRGMFLDDVYPPSVKSGC